MDKSPQNPAALKDARGDSAAPTPPVSFAATATFQPPRQQDESQVATCELPARYRVIGEIGKGGMGVVLRAMDLDIQRHLAVKVTRHTGDPAADERLREESRITGQLQHPGIPPVHEIGRLTDGRPFFSMKLIEGRTLAELLKERSSPEADLPRWIKLFEQVAQTLAYAHSQRVIHRDLKPLNIMVGPFGEVQVMDWGLARRLTIPQNLPATTAKLSSPAAPIEVAPSQHAQSAETQPLPAETDRDRRTQEGDVLGTPAYMPPEQARGEQHLVNERCDVFALGAILCELLTGQPPYVSRKEQSSFEQAVRADLEGAFRRLDASGADPELVSLAKICLAPDLAGRPASAAQVAEQVTGYLTSVQDRLHAAELASAAAQAKAGEERKRRRVTLALAATALLLIGGTSLAAVVYRQQQAETAIRREQTERDVTSALTEGKATLDAVDRELFDRLSYQALVGENARWMAALGSADSSLKRARSLLDSAPPGISPSLSPELLNFAARLEDGQKNRRLAQRLENIRLENSSLAKDGASVGLETPKYFAAFLEAGLDMKQEEPAALGAKIRNSLLRWPLVAALDHWSGVRVPAERQEFNSRLLQIARAADPDPWRDRFRNLQVRFDPAALAKMAAEPEVAQQSPQIIDALAAALHRAGGDAMPLLRSASVRYPRDFWIQFDAGIGAKTPAEQASYFRAATTLRPEASIAYNNLANALTSLRQFKLAEDCCLKAIELEPAYAVPKYNLGLLYMDQKLYPQAIAQFEKMLALNPQGETAAWAHTAIGICLMEQDRTKEALARYHKAIEVNPAYNLPYNNLGLWNVREENMEEAVRLFEKSLQLNRKYAPSYCNLGYCLQKQGKVEEAMRLYQQALAISPQLFLAHYHMGNAWRAQNRIDEALVSYRRALQGEQPSAVMLSNLGSMFHDLKQTQDALAACRLSIELDPSLPMAYHNLGVVLQSQRQHEPALTALRKALEIDPKYASAQFNIGCVLYSQRKVDEAVAAFEKVLQIDPKYNVYNNLAVALQAKGRLEEAVAAYRQGIVLLPKDATLHDNLGQALYGQLKFAEAAAAYKKALEINPAGASTHYNLGLAEVKLGLFADALASFQKAHELGSKQPGWSLRSGPWVLDCQRLLALEKDGEARSRIAAQATDAVEHLSLGNLSQMYRKAYASAARFYASAFAADPPLLTTPNSRFNAACAASLAAEGKGSDAAGVTEEEKARFRQLARGWLRQESAAWKTQLESSNPAAQSAAKAMVQLSLTDSDLAVLRDEPLLEQLPPAEQADCRSLWAEIRGLLKGVSP
ncbi:MAG: tetratricopeptide repeat protein [Pirellulaceae bacterium]